MHSGGKWSLIQVHSGGKWSLPSYMLAFMFFLGCSSNFGHHRGCFKSSPGFWGLDSDPYDFMTNILLLLKILSTIPCCIDVGTMESKQANTDQNNNSSTFSNCVDLLSNADV